jgi:hypothetical protein
MYIHIYLYQDSLKAQTEAVQIPPPMPVLIENSLVRGINVYLYMQVYIYVYYNTFICI